MPAARARSNSAVQVGHAHGELADHGAGVDRLEAERLARVVGPAQHQLRQLHEAALAEPGEVDHAGEGVQRLRGADVVGGLLAPDVLLARLQREHEAAAPVHVARLARDPARHPADEALRRGEEAEARAAEVQPVPERLALADADVRAELARRPQDAERERVGGAPRTAPPCASRPRTARRGPPRCRGSSAAARRPPRCRRPRLPPGRATSVAPSLGRAAPPRPPCRSPRHGCAARRASADAGHDWSRAVCGPSRASPCTPRRPRRSAPRRPRRSPREAR